MTQAELQRWSREVAEDPGAPSFVALARAYRRQGRHGHALRVVLRGLERQPENVEAHALLALLHVDAGERERAGDEWETVLSLEPGHFDASRGLGFLSLERGDLTAARRHLELAVRIRPGEPTVTQALEVLARRETSGVARAAAARPVGVSATTAAAGRDVSRDPARLFEPLAGETPFLGALLLDAQGLAVAGAMTGTAGDGETLGALLVPTVDEARRTAGLLGLGEWSGMLLDAETATVYVSAVEVGDGVLLLAVRKDAPAGWVLRTADRARSLAQRFLAGER